MHGSKSRGEAALRDVCWRILMTEPEDGPEMLGIGAMRLGAFVGAGLLDGGEAARALMLLAPVAGMADADEAMALIDAGLERGARGGLPAEGPAGRRLHTLSDWADEPVPERRWLVEGWIPMAATTVLYGDGGTGKSLLAQQLATAVAAGGTFLGLKPRRGPVMALFCEDDEGELKRRQHAIMAATGAAWPDLADLRAMTAVGEANLLMTFNGAGIGALTEWGVQWLGMVEAAEPVLMVVDTAADTFGGNENARLEVRQFMSALNGLARRTGAAVVLLAHPSVSGLTNGRGHSGSTAWTNGARSHLYLSRAEDKDGEADTDPNLRLLSRRKANYAAAGDALKLVWRSGAFGLQAAAPAEFRGLSSPETRCLEALRALTKERLPEGATLFDAVTDGVTRVALAAWQSRACNAGLTDCNGRSTARVAFYRAKKVLKNNGLIEFDDKTAWLTVTGVTGAFGVTPDSPGAV